MVVSWDLGRQVLVRGLEGVWGGVSRRFGLKIPAGDLILFGYVFFLWDDTFERFPDRFVLMVDGCG